MRIVCVHQGYELYGSDRAFIDSVAALREAWPQADIEVVLPHDGPICGPLRASATRIVIEPLPWPGNPARPIDDTNRGVNLFEVVDPKSGEVLYSRGFSTVFGEWRSTEEARRLSRAFQ